MHVGSNSLLVSHFASSVAAFAAAASLESTAAGAGGGGNLVAACWSMGFGLWDGKIDSMNCSICSNVNSRP